MQQNISSKLAAKCLTGKCRGCGHTGLAPVLDYGPMPASDGFEASPGQDQPQARFPLELVFCEQCSLLQILETLEPQKLFGAGYLYLSSCSDSWLEHCRINAENIVSRFGLGANSLVIEIASNDGYLLQYFKQQGVPVLGIDPAPEPVRLALERGIETINEFFTLELAHSLRETGRADVVISNNVLAHVADIHGFIDGIREVLSANGTWVIEVPYVKDLVNGCAFDTVYHEHLCYFSVSSVQYILRRHRLYVNDIETLASHGGSLRLYVSKKAQQSERVSELLLQEQRDGIGQLDYYLSFASRAKVVCRNLASMLEELAARNFSIAAYGAAAKGTILLNCLGEAANHIKFAADRNSLKHGKRVPGLAIPIVPVSEIKRQLPDYLLMLPWNLRGELVLQERDYLLAGGSFIVPLPLPEIISGDDL